MPVAVGALVLVCLPILVIAVVWLRIRAKERARDAYLEAIREELGAAGAEPLGTNVYRLEGRAVKVEASTNPLFARGFTVRLAAFSSTIHEFELKRGAPVAHEFESFRPLLGRWESAGKMFIECYAAGVRNRTGVTEDLRSLIGLAALPLSRTFRGGTFTIREGFEKVPPQWHWRHDQRPRLPREIRRWCVSFWQGSPLLNPVLARILHELAGDQREFFLTDREDLSFLEHAFGREGIERRGTLVEFAQPDRAVAADLYTDGEFFGGLLAADAVPPGFEGPVPRYRYHDAAIQVLPQVTFYARRLFDDEFSWYSGEYEILSVQPLDVRGALARIAAEIGAQIMELDRRFHKRIVVPFDH